MEAQCHIVTENWRKQNEVKQNEVQVNAVKKLSRITKRGSSFENILTVVVNLRSDINTTEDSTESVLQGILSLCADTLKDAFFCLVGNIHELPYLKKRTVLVDITQR